MQTDLFEIPVDTPAQQGANKFAFLDRYRFSIRLDQVLAASILLIMVYVLVFSFGVEKGKRFAMAELRAERSKRERMVQELREKLIENKVFPAQQEETAVISGPKKVPVKTAVMASAAVVNEEAKKIAPAAALAAENPPVTAKGYPQGKYTIQLVTYRSQTTVNKMIGELLKKGIHGFVIPKGSHLQVCANAFENEAQAKQALGQMKAQKVIPPDAFVRMIPQ